MLTEPVDLRDSYPIAQNFVDFVLIHQLRLADGNGLFLCYPGLFLLFSWLHKVLYFHRILVVAFPKYSFVLAVLLSDNINARPDFSEPTGAQFFLAQVLASNVLFRICNFNFIFGQLLLRLVVMLLRNKVLADV